MSLFWIYLSLVLIIIAIEAYKASARKSKQDIVESWEEYNVRVHSRIPRYNGPNPFERRPMSFYESIKRVIMFPIAVTRVILFMLIVIFGAIVSIPASKLGFQRKATSRILRGGCRLILFVFGFYSISVTNLNDDSVDISKAARTIIANHHTVFDGFLLLYYTNGVIAATSELAEIPFFGDVMIALQSLFINRHGKDGRNRAKQQIIDHIYNENLPPLMIFPQGTTCSIYTLTTFKSGAFLSKKPVLPIVFNWSHNKNYDISFVGPTSMLRDMISAGSQLVNYVHITILKPYQPQHNEDVEPHKFAENTRILMSKYIASYCIMTPHSLTDHLLHDFACNRNDYHFDIQFLMSDISSTLKLKSKTVQYLAKKFSALDLNGNGYIVFEEFCVAFNRDPIKHFDKMSKLFQLFCVNNNVNRIGFDEFLNGVSICFVDSMISDAIRVVFDACSDDNKWIKPDVILGVYQRQIDKKRFSDAAEYETYFDKIKFFVNVVFNNKKQMDFNAFHKVIIDKKLTNAIQEFLQIIIMFRLKIKLQKSDFRTESVDNDDEPHKQEVFVQQHPRSIRSDSILSVGHTNLGMTKNTI